VAGGQVHGLDLADPRQLPHRCEPLLDPLPAASARARDAPLAQAPARPSPTTSHGGLWPRELEKDYVLEESGCYRPIYLGTDRWSTATLFRDGLPRAGLPAFWITKTPEAACVQATVSEWPSRPDVAAAAAITERDWLSRPGGRRVRAYRLGAGGQL